MSKEQRPEAKIASGHPIIVKPRGESRPQPNLADYAATCADFSWQRGEQK